MNEKDENPIPDPSGPPEPVKEKPSLASNLFDKTLYIVLGGFAFILVSGALTPTSGSTRSATLKWQKACQARNEEIQKAMKEERRATE